MSFISDLFGSQSIASSLLYISLAAFSGILVGKICIRHVRLGIAGVLFTGIALTQAGAIISPDLLHFVRDFGLILFVYAIGIDVGPRFFSSFRKEGLQLNALALLLIVSGLMCAWVSFGQQVSVHKQPPAFCAELCLILLRWVQPNRSLPIIQQPVQPIRFPWLLP